MRFIIINPHKRTVYTFECKDLSAAKQEAGLNEVDHGTVAPGLGIVVYEFGLYTDPDTARYFGFNGRLYSGNAVLYAYDQIGNTIDTPEEPLPIGLYPRWFDGRIEIEEHIAAGLLQRPEARVNGQLVWSWPNLDRI